MTETQVRVRTADEILAESEQDHWVCCLNKDLTLCGLSMPEAEEAEFEESGCVVCDDMVDDPFCPYSSRPCPDPDDWPDP